VKKSALFAKVFLFFFVLGSCFLPGCEVLEEFVCPCTDPDYPAYYPGGEKCYLTTGDCESDNPGKICKECGI
jgi:hypothetical protein